MVYFAVQAFFVALARLAIIIKKKKEKYNPKKKLGLLFSLITLTVWLSSGFMLLLGIIYVFYDTGARVCAGVDGRQADKKD